MEFLFSAGVIVILWFSKEIDETHSSSSRSGKVDCPWKLLSEESIETTSKDEIGELVLNFNIMKKNQKKAEEQIRQNEAFLQSITTNMGEGMLVMDLEGRLTFMNPEAERLLGMDSKTSVSIKTFMTSFISVKMENLFI